MPARIEARPGGKAVVKIYTSEDAEAIETSYPSEADAMMALMTQGWDERTDGVWLPNTGLAEYTAANDLGAVSSNHVTWVRKWTVDHRNAEVGVSVRDTDHEGGYNFGFKFVMRETYTDSWRKLDGSEVDATTVVGHEFGGVTHNFDPVMGLITGGMVNIACVGYWPTHTAARIAGERLLSLLEKVYGTECIREAICKIVRRTAPATSP